MTKHLRRLALLGLFCGTTLTGVAHAQVLYLHHAKPAVTVSPAAPTAAPAPAVVVQPVPNSAIAGANTPAPPPVMTHPAPPTGASALSADNRPRELVTEGGVALTSSADNTVIPDTEFGSNIPLNLALTSIVPSTYKVAYANVDQQRTVNWGGGRGWRDTLLSLCSAYGYSVKWAGDTVIISGADSAPTSAPVPVSVASAVPTPSASAPSSPTQGAPDSLKTKPVERIQNSSSVNTQQVITDRREAMRSGDTVEIVDPNRPHQNAPSGHMVTRRAAADDGDMLVANSKSALMEQMPTMSYAPKNGGYGVYYAAQGQDLYQVLCVWAGANGWKVDYRDVHLRYPIEADVTLRDDFKAVAKKLIHSIHAQPAPLPLFYNGNKTLRVYNYEAG